MFHHSECGYQFKKLLDHGLEEEAEKCVNFIVANDIRRHCKEANPHCGSWLLNRVEAMQ